MHLPAFCCSARLLLLAGLVTSYGVTAQGQPLSFRTQQHAVTLLAGETMLASYVFRDPQVPRPYFAQVQTLSGQQVTRRHPPVSGEDADDHVGLHPGIWLSFGDLSGHDYWRLKAATEHVRFVEPPTVTAAGGRFTVLNRYRTTDGLSTVAEETCRQRIVLVPGGYRLEFDSEFRAGDVDLVFGDQEEMGLGIRAATPLVVDRQLGGRILDSAGRRNGSEVWGRTADWCDYAGPLNGRWAGLTVLAHPDNFRASWSHARDYGFLAMNPFGRHAFTKQDPSRVVVRPGESLRLRFAVVVHETAAEADYQPSAAWQSWVHAGAPRK